jgi:hypothetical protein
LPETNEQPAGFRLFAFTWAVACLFHQLSFTDWRWHSVQGIALTASILWVLFKPSSWRRFAVMLIVDWVCISWAFPYHPNHIVFSWILSGTMLTALLIVLRQDASEGDLASRWFRAFAPWLRIELCLLYFFTVFHKLNGSYFELDWSCAAKMHREISDWMPLLPGAKWAQYAAIYGTLIIETAIPLLLLFGRTRVAGVILGMLFHGLLALHPHPGLFSFSSLMTACFTAFIPFRTAASLMPSERFQNVWRQGLWVVTALYGLWIIRSWLPSWLSPEEYLQHISRVGFFAYHTYLFVGLFMFVRSIQKRQHEIQSQAEGTWVAYPFVLIFPLLLSVNGFGPYLGLRTQTSFSMFSNLHTENGVNNHLIVPSGIQLTRWQYDVVEIIDSSDPDLISARDNDFLIVFLDLRRRRSVEPPDWWVTFRRNGRVETFDAAKPETHGVLLPLGPLARRYFFFRPVERDPGHVRCKH